MNSQSHPIDVHVGQRLRSLRLENGMTQEDLGAAVGVSYQQIQKYETGSNRISASRLYILARYLNVGPEYFFAEMDSGLLDGMQVRPAKTAASERPRRQ